jgi:hypothetical protein
MTEQHDKPASPSPTAAAGPPPDRAAGAAGAWIKAGAALAAVAGFFLIASLFRPSGSEAGFTLGEESPHSRTPGGTLDDEPPADTDSLGSLHSREYRVDIVAGEYAGEALYTVRTADGALLGERLTRSEADRLFPNLDLDSMLAAPVGAVDIPLDAWND